MSEGGAASADARLANSEKSRAKLKGRVAEYKKVLEAQVPAALAKIRELTAANEGLKAANEGLMTQLTAAAANLAQVTKQRDDAQGASAAGHAERQEAVRQEPSTKAVTLREREIAALRRRASELERALAEARASAAAAAPPPAAALAPLLTRAPPAAPESSATACLLSIAQVINATLGPPAALTPPPEGGSTATAFLGASASALLVERHSDAAASSAASAAGIAAAAGLAERNPLGHALIHDWAWACQCPKPAAESLWAAAYRCGRPVSRSGAAVMCGEAPFDAAALALGWIDVICDVSSASTAQYLAAVLCAANPRAASRVRLPEGSLLRNTLQPGAVCPLDRVEQTTYLRLLHAVPVTHRAHARQELAHLAADPVYSAHLALADGRIDLGVYVGHHGGTPATAELQRGVPYVGLGIGIDAGMPPRGHSRATHVLQCWQTPQPLVFRALTHGHVLPHDANLCEHAPMLPLMAAGISVNATGGGATISVGLEFLQAAHAAVTRDLAAYASRLLGSPPPGFRRGAILIVCSHDPAPELFRECLDGMGVLPACMTTVLLVDQQDGPVWREKLVEKVSEHRPHVLLMSGTARAAAIYSAFGSLEGPPVAAQPLAVCVDGHHAVMVRVADVAGVAAEGSCGATIRLQGAACCVVRHVMGRSYAPQAPDGAPQKLHLALISYEGCEMSPRVQMDVAASLNTSGATAVNDLQVACGVHKLQGEGEARAGVRNFCGGVQSPSRAFTAAMPGFEVRWP